MAKTGYSYGINDESTEQAASLFRLSVLKENIPGHAHKVVGIWDSNNGTKAGTECEECIRWNNFVQTVKERDQLTKEVHALKELYRHMEKIADSRWKEIEQLEGVLRDISTRDLGTGAAVCVTTSTLREIAKTFLDNKYNDKRPTKPTKQFAELKPKKRIKKDLK